MTNRQCKNMWKRTKSELDDITTPNVSPLIAPAPPSARSAPEPSGHESATFGPLVVITGEIKGGEDLTIEGRVEGTIELKQNTLTIGVNATAKADIVAKDIVVLGKVDENVTVSSKVEIGPDGTVEGDIVSPAVSIAEGATFRGSIDMKNNAAEST